MPVRLAAQLSIRMVRAVVLAALVLALALVSGGLAHTALAGRAAAGQQLPFRTLVAIS